MTSNGDLLLNNTILVLNNTILLFNYKIFLVLKYVYTNLCKPILGQNKDHFGGGEIFEFYREKY